jgi:hypothetical protein
VAEAIAMEAKEILARAKDSTRTPADWVVFPLQRRKVIFGLLEWVMGIIMGLGLFALVASIVIPYNYQHGIGPAFFSTIFLAIFLFVFLGSIYLLISDIRRLRNADQHIIVITPRDFVKQEGKKVISVPLSHVRYVTARGKPAPSQTMPTAEESTVRDVPGAGESMLGFLFGRGLTSSGKRWRRRRMRTPTSLAFLDARTDKEVVVVDDMSYGDPFLIADILKQHAASVQGAIA